MAKAKINIFHLFWFLVTVSWCIRGNLTSGLIDVVKSLLINNQVENAQLIELMSSKGGLVLNDLSIFWHIQK